MTAATHAGPAVGSFLEANLAAIGVRNPGVAEQIRRAPDSQAIEFIEGEDGLSGAVDGRSLASKRHPVREGVRLAESVDLKQSGAFVFLGFGLGHHVAAFARRAGRRALVVVFEPDLSLLKATLSRVDHAGWIADTNTVFLTDAGDSAAVSAALEGAEPMLAMGVKFIEHPPSRRRLAGIAGQFSEVFNGVIAAVRTTVVTTMVQTETSMRNALSNLRHYVGAGASGIADLAGACEGRPAIVVSAGPSLQRNIDQLAREGLRDRCVIIAVQTALKPLLARGIRPHFVTALDYHEVSKRFYEGLTASDVKGVTLVVEPKAHPSIANAFPGRVRCASDPNLDTLLGAELAGEHGAIKAGSTVAHLAYYLARHMGCSRIILVGQDLAFTDGQYYSDGAAIHETWAPELNPFTTLEMFEWERIARLRSTLRTGTDTLGRRVYTDEQMWTYHAQFEREFRTDTERGVEIIDATEGGLRKAHTTAMTLGEANERLPSGINPTDALFGATTAADGAHGGAAAVSERIRSIRQNAGRIEQLSRETADLLGHLADQLNDRAATDRLIGEIYDRRDTVTALEPAYSLVQRLDQTGAFNRARTDRDIDLTEDLNEQDRQRRQIERDRTNVLRLSDAAATLCGMLEDALRLLQGTKQPVATARSVKPRMVADRRATIAAVVIDDGETPVESLRGCVSQVGSCSNLSETIVLSGNSGASAVRLGGGQARIIEDEMTGCLARLDRIRRVRAYSRDCWRGGIGAMTWADEALAPAPALRALEASGCTAAFVVDPKRSDLDAALCDRIMRRHLDEPDGRPVAFSQAAPGRAGMVLDASVIRDIAEAADENSPFAFVGGVLRYNPRRPSADPIAKGVCEPTDLAQRFPEATSPPQAPGRLVLEIATGRSGVGGERSLWFDRSDEHFMAPDQAVAVLERFVRANPDGCVTLAGRGDPLVHPHFREIVQAAQGIGVYALHVRTDLCCDDATLESLALADVISVDLLASTAETYRALTGCDAFEQVSSRFAGLCRSRQFVGGVPKPWVVPRLTRCDAVYAEIEPFYDYWTALLGHAVIDPLPRAVDGQRISPLRIPEGARRRIRFNTMCVRADGAVVNGTADACDGDVTANLSSMDLMDAWAALAQQRECVDS